MRPHHEQAVHWDFSVVVKVGRFPFEHDLSLMQWAVIGK